jgi:hypothetical protein
MEGAMWRAGESPAIVTKPPDYQTPSKLKSRLDEGISPRWANQLSTAGASVLIG